MKKTRLVDKEDNEVVATKFGQLVVANRNDDISVRFEYGNSSHDVDTTASGSAAVSNANSMATLTSGAEISRAIISSKRHVVYHPGHEIQAYFTAILNPATDAASYLRAGIYDDDDGFYLGYDADDFRVACRSGGVTTTVSQSAFNKDRVGGAGGQYNKSSFNLDTSKLNIYRITYGWLGIAPIAFSVYGGQDRGWITMHVFDLGNTQAIPSTESPSNHVRMEAGRSAGSGNAVSLSTASWNAGSTGVSSSTGHRGFSQKFEITASAGVTGYMGTIRNNTTHLTKANKIRAELTYFGASTDGNKSVNFELIKNAVLASTSYTDTDSNNSVIAYDTAGTASAGTSEMTFPMQKIDTLPFDMSNQHISLLPGETLSITARGSANNTVTVSLRWKEIFS
jgi:hypothetical protein